MPYFNNNLIRREIVQKHPDRHADKEAHDEGSFF